MFVLRVQQLLLWQVLKVVQEIMVCEKVQFTLNSEDDTPKILLPWTPAVYQEMELIVTGGQLPSYDSRDLFFSSLKTHGDLMFSPQCRLCKSIE